MEEEDGEASARRFPRGAAGDAIAKRNTIAMLRVTRTAKTPNGEQTLLYAADEVVKAAPPNTSCSSPAGPGMGRLCVNPGLARVTL